MSTAISSRTIQKSCKSLLSAFEMATVPNINRQTRHYYVRSSSSSFTQLNKILQNSTCQSSCDAKRMLHVVPPRNVASPAIKFANLLPEEDTSLQFEVKHFAPEKDLGNAKWLRKADTDAQIYHEANRYGTRMAFGRVTLNCAKPLDYDMFKKAFEIVKSGCPNLNQALESREGELWVKQYLESKIDFEVLPDDINDIDAIEDSASEGFDSSDKPQWRVKVIPRSSDTTCVIPGIRDNFPYQYDFILHVNHAFADGINVAYVVHLTHLMLEKLMSGKTVPEGKQFGHMSGVADLKEMEAKLEKSLWSNSKKLSALVDAMPQKGRSLLITEAFQKPQSSKAATEHICRIIDSKVMDNFNELSKNAGVTFNSSLVALINVAMVELMKEAGIDRDSYKIFSNQIVNLRRYLKNQKSMALGAHQYPLSHSSVVNKSVLDNFWDYVKSYNEDLQANLNSEKVLEQKVVMNLMSKTTSPIDRLANPPPILHDFGVSNLGELSTFIPGKGKHSHITDLVAYNTIHRMIHNQLHQVVSYKGRARYTLSYDTSYMTKVTATKVADKVMELLVKLSN